MKQIARIGDLPQPSEEANQAHACDQTGKFMITNAAITTIGLPGPAALVTHGRSDRFEVIETFIDESHLIRSLLKCREGGQLYFCKVIDCKEATMPNIPLTFPSKIDLILAVSSALCAPTNPRARKLQPMGAS